MDAVDFWWTPIYPFNAKYFRILLSTTHKKAKKIARQSSGEWFNMATKEVKNIIQELK